jgi:hypothetical protein
VGAYVNKRKYLLSTDGGGEGVSSLSRPPTMAVTAAGIVTA